MSDPIYSQEFQSNLEDMAAAIREALSVLTRHGWVVPEAQFELHLCLEEALVNAIHHGNKGDRELTVRLEIEENGDLCRIRVYDNGQGFCPMDIPSPDPDTPGGRGLCLIKHFMDDVKYIDNDQCFEMTFRRKGCCRGEKTHERG